MNKVEITILQVVNWHGKFPQSKNLWCISVAANLLLLLGILIPHDLLGDRLFEDKSSMKNILLLQFYSHWLQEKQLNQIRVLDIRWGCKKGMANSSFPGWCLSEEKHWRKKTAVSFSILNNTMPCREITCICFSLYTHASMIKASYITKSSI